MRRGHLAGLLLALVLLGVLWPTVAAAASCGDCCERETRSCGRAPAAGFSFCCFNSASVLSDLPLTGLAPSPSSRLSFADETGRPSPDPRDILHVPRSF